MTGRRRFAIALLSWLAPFAAAADTADRGKPMIAGWAETVRICPGNVRVNAKLDTGANTSSLHVRHPEYYKRDGADWVRFEFENTCGKKALIDRPVLRIASIKEDNEVVVQRPAIKIGICIGDIHEEAEVTLSDRTGYNFALLLGRRFLQGKVLVDPGAKRLLVNDCTATAPAQ